MVSAPARDNVNGGSMRRLIDLVPLLLMLLAAYVEFSNIVMGWSFWLLLAVLATAYAAYKLFHLMPDDRTDVSKGKDWWAITCEVVLFLFGVFIAVVMWRMLAMAPA